MAGRLVEDAFRPLREEADRVTNALGQLLTAIRRASGAGGAGGADAGAAVAANNAQEKAVKSASKLKDEIRTLSTSYSGLTRAVRGAGDLAKAFGFEDASKKASELAHAMEGVRNVAGGLAATLNGLRGPLGVFAIAGASVVGFQEGIRAATGVTLTFKGVVQSVGLAVAQFVNYSIYGWRLALNDFRGWIVNWSRQIVDSAITPIARVLRTMRQAMLEVTQTLVANQGLVPQQYLDDAHNAAKAVSGAYRVVLDAVRSNRRSMRESVDDTKDAHHEIVESYRAWKEGITSQINEVMDTEQGQRFLSANLGGLLGSGTTGGGIGGDLSGFMGKFGAVATDGPGIGTEAFKAKAADVRFLAAAEAAQVSEAYIGAIEYIGSATQQTAAAISGALLDAFLDPQKDIRESFSSLFKSLAQQLLQMLVQAALVRAVAFAGGFAYGGIQTLGGALFGAEGGSVPGDLGRARGYALGGLARPNGVPASDTIAAWLTPGEYVMRLSAVARYGEDVMSRINAGLVDRGELRAVAAGTPVPASTGPGYAAGGSVSGGAAGVSMAMVVGNDQNARNVLEGGRGAVLDFMGQNASAIKAKLGIR